MRHVLALFVLAVPPMAQVHVVDPAGGAGVDFTGLEEAVAGVPPGSLLLARPGAYGMQFLTIDRSLTIVGDGDVSFSGQIRVAGLGAGEHVTLANLTVNPTNVSENLTIEDCDGSVWVENCTFTGFEINQFSGAQAAIVRRSDSVVLVECTFIGGGPFGFPPVGGSGVFLQDATVHAFGCDVEGGVGATNPSGDGAMGGAGVTLSDAFLFAAESTFRGGTGGATGVGFFGCITPGTGGTGGFGLRLVGSTSDARLLNVALLGGDGGPARIPGPGCNPGASGEPFEVVGGSITQVLGAAHGFDAPNPVREGDVIDLDFVGAPGELAWYLFSDQETTLFLPALLGTLTLDFPLLVVPVPNLDGSGLLSIAVPGPALPPLTDGADFYLQSLFFDGLTFTLGEPSVLSVVAAGF